MLIIGLFAYCVEVYQSFCRLASGNCPCEASLSYSTEEINSPSATSRSSASVYFDMQLQ